MRGIALRWLTLTGAILLASYLLDGIHVSGFMSAVGAAAILGILNAFFRPIALILTLPINILTLGLFTFVINAVMLKMASGVIDVLLHGLGAGLDHQCGELVAQYVHQRTGPGGCHRPQTSGRQPLGIVGHEMVLDHTCGYLYRLTL